VQTLVCQIRRTNFSWDDSFQKTIILDKTVLTFSKKTWTKQQSYIILFPVWSQEINFRGFYEERVDALMEAAATRKGIAREETIQDVLVKIPIRFTLYSP